MKENVEDIILKRVAYDINHNGMKISEDTMLSLVLYMYPGASFSSLEAVRDWFNSKNVAQLPEKEQERYIGAVVNLFTLIATNDVENLVKNWVLAGLE